MSIYKRNNDVAIVTASDNGIGLATAKGLTKTGIHVILGKVAFILFFIIPVETVSSYLMLIKSRVMIKLLMLRQQLF